MNNLAKLITDGKITVEDLANGAELIERAKFVKEGLEACKKTLKFPIGETTISCYSYMDSAGEYEAWGECTNAGVFTCSCNWGGNHQIGGCNLLDFKDVFLAFENSNFAPDLKRFLEFQIRKSKAD